MLKRVLKYKGNSIDVGEYVESFAINNVTVLMMLKKSVKRCYVSDKGNSIDVKEDIESFANTYYIE